MSLAHDYHELMVHFHDRESVMAFLDCMMELDNAFPQKESIRSCIKAYKFMYPEDRRAGLKLFMEESYLNGVHNPIRHLLLNVEDPILVDTVLHELKYRGNYLDNLQGLAHSSHNHWDVDTENHIARVVVDHLTASEKTTIITNNVTRFPTLIRVIHELRDHHYIDNN